MDTLNLLTTNKTSKEPSQQLAQSTLFIYIITITVPTDNNMHYKK